MLKRLLVLAVALTLFVTAFLIYFHISDARIEHNFRAEREQYHVEGLQLTTATPPVEAPAAAPAPPPLPSAAVPVPSASTPGGSPNAGNPPFDSILNPAPPASNATPGDSTAPATNSSSDSTLIYPGLRQLPSALMASFNNHGLRIQAPGGATTVPTVPDTTTAAPPVAPAPAEAVGTNVKEPVPAAVNAPHAATPVAASAIVLGFHQFSPPGVRSKNIYNMPQDVFDGEMKYLKDNGYHVVPLSDVVRFAKGEIGLPPDSVAVTIDDGYKSAINYAAPVLKKYGFPWTFFIYPAFITVHEGKGAASWNDLVELQNEGVDIECHSMTHPMLSKHRQKWKGPAHALTPEEYDAFLTNETATAKAILEQHLNKQIKYFAYPYGEYNKEVEAKVIAAGFQAIFTVANNPIHPGTNVYAMGRYVITAPVEKAYASFLRQGALGIGSISPAPGSTISDPRPVISAVLGYEGTIKPESIITEVRDMGDVRHDFDPKSSTLRLYLPRDLIDPAVVVNIHAKDATSGQNLTASWRFNYQPTAPGVAHAPIGAPTTNHPAVMPPSAATPANETNAVNEGESNIAPVKPAPASNIKSSNSASIPAPASNAVPSAPTTP